MDLLLFLQILTLVFGFYMAWNIGANDVANAMGTSVGSKALTLRKAVVLAAILEFSGAFFVGSTVSETIQKGIVNPEIFEYNPLVFVTGMLGALLATGLWLQLASYFGLPVSTTHAIVGAVIGFGAVIGGVHAVHWMEVLSISFSWVLSPLLSGFLSYLLFSLLQRKIFFSLRPVDEARKIVPFLAFFCFTIFLLSILYEGLSNLHLHLNFPRALFFSCCFGILAFFVYSVLLRKLALKQTPENTPKISPQHMISLEKAAKHLRRVQLNSEGELHDSANDALKQVHELREKIKKEASFEQNYHPYHQVEKIFVYLQVISASLVAFAHGANDVANAIGPVAAIVEVLRTQIVTQNTAIPSWLLAFGGVGIVVGLATWGWRVIETIGKKITELTPTRGFCAEFGAAATILLASKMGMPISTTHSLVGAVLGVGLARGLRAINLRTLRDIALSWIVTIPICAVLSIILFFIINFFVKS